MAEIFSTVMRGYKKEEVLNYIADLSEQLDQLKTILDSKEVTILRLKEELGQEEEKAAAPNEDVLETIRREIKAEIEAEYESKIVAAREEALKEASNAKENDEVIRKAKEYDECKDALADLMIQARKNADEIVAKAEATAQVVRAKADVEFTRLRSEFALLQQTVGNLRADVQCCLDGASEQVAAFEYKIGEIQSEIDKTIDAAAATSEN